LILLEPNRRRNAKTLQSRPASRKSAKSGRVLGVADNAPAAFAVQSEARGSHWIAWLVRGGSGKPERSLVFVGETREKAEENARAFANQARY
jgi:hypothetical protein